ncbi:MAG: hypothetical protein J1F07_02380 [Muribaculaceae bacterium]|nr:hypothetical protein [Muribaculaceae bacterium]
MKKLLSILSAILFAATFTACVNDQPATSDNSPMTIDVNNYMQNTQNIHPKVLYFPEGWHGYRFWMAYTPYPNGAVDCENPCIAASHDGLNWEDPKGLSNPLATAPEGGYNSDTHLVYDAAHDRLECWWRKYNIATTSDAICRRVSGNGIDWEPEELLLDWQTDNRLSPTVWIEDGKYRMIYSNGRFLYHISTPVGKEKKEWSEPEKLPVDWGNLAAWHQDLITDENGDLEIVVCCYVVGEGNNNAADLYYVKVKGDLTEATAPAMILHRGENEEDFDWRSIYRSSIVKVDGEYYIYYSCIGKNWERHMSLLRGPSPFELRGLTRDDMGW